MKRETTLARRNAAKLLVLGSGAVLLGRGAAAGREPPGPDRTDAARAIARGFFHHSKSARIIGQEYLRIRPDEANESLLLDLVLSGLPRADEVSSDHPRDLISHRIRADFGRSDVVRLQGWVASVTEARLCAIVSLRADSR